MFQSPLVVLLITNLLTLGGMFYVSHDKDTQIEKLKLQVDNGVLKLEVCDGKIALQNQSVLLLEEFGNKQQEFLDKALDGFKSSQKESEVKIARILNQRIPKDCRGALDHLKTTSQELSEW